MWRPDILSRARLYQQEKERALRAATYGGCPGRFARCYYTTPEECELKLEMQRSRRVDNERRRDLHKTLNREVETWLDEIYGRRK